MFFKIGVYLSRFLLTLISLLLCLPSFSIGNEKPLLKMKADREHIQLGQDEQTVSVNVDTKEWVDEKTGQTLPLDVAFKNAQGQSVTLRELIDRPTLLLPVYYYCPRSCSFDLANLATAIANSKHPIGSFRIITMSFNDVETSEVAAKTKPNFLELLDKDFPDELWSFLTGDSQSIKAVTDAIGYTFKKQDDFLFIHPSAMVALAEDGQIIKYIYGSFISGDVDLALAEAEKGTPATSIRRFLSFCFNYSPTQNQKIFTILKLATVTLLAGGLFYFIFFVLRRSK